MEKVFLYGVLTLILIIAMSVTFNFVSPYLAFIMFFAAIYFLVKFVSAWIKHNADDSNKK